MARPFKHDERTRQALLDAAEALLAAGGSDAVTVRAVADAVGESTRAVYSVFGSMPALMGALGARGFQLVADMVNALPQTDDPIADVVAAGAVAFRRFALTRPHLFRITYSDISEAIYTQPEAFPALLASYQSLASRFERAIAAGLLPERAIVEYVFTFHSFTSGLAVNELSRQPPPVGANFWRFDEVIDFAELWRRSLHAFLRGLAAEEGGAGPGSNDAAGGDQGDAGRGGGGGGTGARRGGRSGDSAAPKPRRNRRPRPASA